MVRGKLLRDAGVEGLREVVITDPPTFLPIGARPERTAEPLPALDQISSPSRSGLPFLTSGDFARAYRSGASDPVAVAERFLVARAEIDTREGGLNAFVAVNPEDVLAQARASRDRLARGAPRSWLEGVPIGIKDELDQLPYPSTVGTRVLGKAPAPEDSTVVARLRALGALLVGKLNMNEIGINPNGSNEHHGLVRNPHDPARDPGGSSSGSAAAVAAGLCPAALGADGGGSIRIPAALCGVVGLKASFGRISEHGAAPLCWSVAHVGPLGATAEDVALIYAAIAGADPSDPMSLAQPAPDLDRFADRTVRGLRIGIFTPWLEHAAAPIVAAIRRLLDRFQGAGAEIREVTIPGLDSIRVAHAITILVEMAAAMARFARSDFGLATRINLALARALQGTDYLRAQQFRTRALAAFARAFESVDVIATPSTAITAPEIPVSRSKAGWSDLSNVTEVMRFAFPSNFTGHPAISFPAGYDPAGLPIGIQLIAPHWQESLLLRLALLAEDFVERRAPRVQARLL